MFEIASKPISIFLDFNAVIVNIDSLPPEKQKKCVAEISSNIKTLKAYLKENISEKKNKPEIPTASKLKIMIDKIVPPAVIFQKIACPSIKRSSDKRRKSNSSFIHKRTFLLSIIFSNSAPKKLKRNSNSNPPL